MADESTHRQIANDNETTMDRLLMPNITGGVSSPKDHPWIAVMAYYTAYHLIEEVVAMVDPDVHLSSHDDQVEFLLKTPGLGEVSFFYDHLNIMRRYALYRPPANVSRVTERQILGYGSPGSFKAVVLDDWLGTIKKTLGEYRESMLSVR